MLNCNDYKLGFVTKMGELFGKICKHVKKQKPKSHTTKTSNTRISRNTQNPPNSRPDIHRTKKEKPLTLQNHGIQLFRITKTKQNHKITNNMRLRTQI